MTFQQVKKYFKSGYFLHKHTGMSKVNFINWGRRGYIPIQSQLKLERLTNGKLKANIKHLG